MRPGLRSGNPVGDGDKDRVGFGCLKMVPWELRVGRAEVITLPERVWEDMVVPLVPGGD